MLPVRTILHPTDFSGQAGAAFEVAVSLARDCGARLVVLHAGRPPAATLGGTVALPPDAEEFGWSELEARLNQIQPAGPVVRVEHRLEAGEPAAVILRVAAECGADVIVMGTHGRRGLRRLLMGSVAEQIVRKAPCPVLTVNGPITADLALPGAAVPAK